MKQATYTNLNGDSYTVDYDPDQPCRLCGYPVQYASVGGTSICPYCDAGRERPEKDIGKNSVELITIFKAKRYTNLTDAHPYCNFKKGDVVDIQTENVVRSFCVSRIDVYEKTRIGWDADDKGRDYYVWLDERQL